MGMIKVIQNGAQDFSEPAAALIRISDRGLLGHDKQAFVKRAGAEFAEKISTIKFAKDEVPVHLIAIGATEDYGPNRNGDGFTRDCCRKYHHTFEKFARFYRDHANKNPAKSYGVVKASYYNEPMRRIELICALNGSKEAAERNGGLIADKELQKLANEQDIPVSMACKIPFDKCSACGNLARTRNEYCDAIENGGHCKAGGLKRNIGKVLADGHVLHADNPNPSFFDISHVFRPADRIAYVSGQLEKAACAGIVCGAELAEQMGVTAPVGYDVRGASARRVNSQLAALHGLAAAERELHVTKMAGWQQMAAAVAAQDQLNPGETQFFKAAEMFKALADRGVILSVRDFLGVTIKTAGDKLVTAVTAALPNIFEKLAADPRIVEDLTENQFYPANTAPVNVRVWAEKVAHSHSLLHNNVEKRAYISAIRGVQPKVQQQQFGAKVGAAEEVLAKHYALYKIAAFAVATENPNNLLTADHCVLQNYIT